MENQAPFAEILSRGWKKEKKKEKRILCLNLLYAEVAGCTGYFPNEAKDPRIFMQQWQFPADTLAVHSSSDVYKIGVKKAVKFTFCAPKRENI